MSVKTLHPIVENTSSSFKLEKDIGQIIICGMSEGDCVCLETSVCITDCDKKWLPYIPSCCGQQCYSFPQNQIFVPVTGEYRLTFSNSDGLNDDDPSHWDEIEIFYDAVASTQNIIDVLGAQNMTCCDKSKPSEMRSIYDGIKIAEHTSGEGVSTEIDFPLLKRNGETLPVIIDSETGKACINIIDENSDTDRNIVKTTETIIDGIKTTCFDLINAVDNTVITANYFCITSAADTIDPNTDTRIVKGSETVTGGVKTTCFNLINGLDNSVITVDYFCMTSDVDTTIPDTIDPNTDTRIVKGAETLINGGSEKETCFDLINVLDNTVITASVFCITSDVDADTTIADTFGTWDGTSITFPDSTVYTPHDPLERCSGVEFNYTTDRVISRNDFINMGVGFVLPWKDNAPATCAPAPITDPCLLALGAVVHSINPRTNDLWEWAVGAWNLKNVSSKIWREDSVPAVIITVTDAELIAANGGASVEYATYEMDIVNDDCVPWLWHGVIAFSAQLAAAEDNHVSFFVGDGVGNQVQLSSSNTEHHSETNGYKPVVAGSGKYATRTSADIQFDSIIAAGTTRKLSIAFDYRVHANNPHIGVGGPNELSLGGHYILSTVTRGAVY